MKRPYVVSADIRLLLKQWADEKGFVISDWMLKDLRDEFSRYMRKIFGEFELAPEDELAEGMFRLVEESGLCPLSLDRVYYHSPQRLDVHRVVHSYNKKRKEYHWETGLWRRPFTPTLRRQFRKIQEEGITEVVLIDDVIFTGTLLERVVKVLRRMNVQVPLVVAGIGVGSGIERIKRQGLEARCVRFYEAVIDQVCERDFYPGVPYSGRTYVGERPGGKYIDKNHGLPYLLPDGDPVEWASIPPEVVKDFSRFCLLQTMHLFQLVECASRRSVYCRDLLRSIGDVESNPLMRRLLHFTHDMRVVEVLSWRAYRLASDRL